MIGIAKKTFLELNSSDQKLYKTPQNPQKSVYRIINHWYTGGLFPNHSWGHTTWYLLAASAWMLDGIWFWMSRCLYGSISAMLCATHACTRVSARLDHSPFGPENHKHACNWQCFEDGCVRIQCKIRYVVFNVSWKGTAHHLVSWILCNRPRSLALGLMWLDTRMLVSCQICSRPEVTGWIQGLRIIDSPSGNFVYCLLPNRYAQHA